MSDFHATARAMIVRDSSRADDGSAEELGNRRLALFAFVLGNDPDNNFPNEVIHAFPEPRNHHLARAIKPLDADDARPDNRHGISLIADHEHGFSGFDVVQPLVRKAKGSVPGGVLGIVGSADPRTPFLDDWSAAQRSTRIVDYLDPRGRTALFAQLVKVTDDHLGQYTPAIVLGRELGNETTEITAPSEDESKGKQKAAGTKRYFVQIVAGFGTSTKIVTTYPDGKTDSFTVAGDVRDAKGVPHDPRDAPKDDAADAAKTGKTTERLKAATVHAPAAGGYLWDGIRNGFLDAVFVINPLDTDAYGREGTPCAWASIKTTAHMDRGADHGPILYTGALDASNPEDGIIYKTALFPDTTVRPDAHASCAWRPYYSVPQIRNCPVADPPPPPPPPPDPPPLTPAGANGASNAWPPSYLDAAFEDGRGQVLTLALTAAAPETAIFGRTNLDTWGALALSHDDAAGRTAWLADDIDAGDATWQRIISMRSGAAVGSAPVAGSSGTFAWSFPTAAAHALLGPIHSDTTTASPVRGSIIVADSTPKWTAFVLGTSGQYLRAGASDPAWSTLAVGDFAAQAANVVAAGPTSGGSSAPTWRAMVAADIPNLDTSKLTTGTLAVARGGTGLATYTTGDILYASGSTTLAKLTAGTATYVLTSNGAGAPPSWQASAAGSAGPLLGATDATLAAPLRGAVVVGDSGPTWARVNRGAANTVLGSDGTDTSFRTIVQTLEGLSSTQGQIGYRGASAWAALAVGTAGQFLRTLGAGANPIWAGVAQADVTGLTTASSPSFSGLTINGAVHITGKATIDGPLDPPSVLLSGGTALFYESNDGSTAPVSGAATGRLRYNNSTAKWEASVQGGAYAAIGGGGSSHALLDGSVVADSVAYTVARGSIPVGNSTPKWGGLALGAANKVLGSDGTDASWRTIAQTLEGLSSTQGELPWRGASAWGTLAPGTNGQVLTTGGTGGDLAYADMDHLGKNYFRSLGYLTGMTTIKESIFSVASYSAASGGGTIVGLGGRYKLTTTTEAYVNYDMGANYTKFLFILGGMRFTTTNRGIWWAKTLSSNVPQDGCMFMDEANSGRSDIYPLPSYSSRLADDSSVSVPNSINYATESMAFYVDLSANYMACFYRIGGEQWWPVFDLTDATHVATSGSVARYVGVYLHSGPSWWMPPIGIYAQ